MIAALLAAALAIQPLSLSVVDELLALAEEARVERRPGGEPTAEDLAAIEAEWPVLAAEVAVVDAECRFHACPDAMSRRHVRRAQAALARVVLAHVNRPHQIGVTQ